MSENIYTITSDVLPASTHVVGFIGKEGLSELYAVEIGLLIADPAFDQDDAVRGRATLEFHLGADSQPYKLHGIFAAVELVHQFGDKALFRALLVPQLWQATQTQHSRVWTDETIPNILRQVIEASGLGGDDYRIELDDESAYPEMEFVAQYKESNYAFISRWMEREGMYFYFEHAESKETLVIVDGKSFTDSDPKPSVKYRPLSEGDHMALEAFAFFKKKSNALPASIELIDYDYLNPDLDVRATEPVVQASYGEISRFGDNFDTPDDGQRLAKIRAQEYLARQTVFHGRGRVFHLRSGYPFALEDHPRGELNEIVYLVTRMRYWGNQSADMPTAKQHLGLEGIDDEYVCEVEAIAGDVQYRAPDRFPWPRIDGYEMATVCGPQDSDYAQIDEHGRYKVQIKFDESDLEPGKKSTWVRMMQPYGGNPEGFHFPLLKGTEVLLFFSGGDPDRPVIAGVVPNAQTPSLVTINNYTQNIIQTVNLNLIRIEDTLNQQYIYIYCPINDTYLHFGFGEFAIHLHTEGHVHFEFHGKQVIDIDLTLEENVKLDVTFNYSLNWIVNVAACNNITIDVDLNLKVGGDVNWEILGDWNIILAGDNNFQIGGDQNIQISGDLNVDLSCDNNFNIGGDQIINIGGVQKIHVKGDQIFIIDGSQDVTIKGKQDVKVLSNWKWEVAGHEIELKKANSTEITVGLKNEIFIGMKNEMKLAVGIALTKGAFLEINLADKLSLVNATSIELAMGAKIALLAGLAIDVVGGVRISGTAGANLELKGGPFVSAEPLALFT